MKHLPAIVAFFIAVLAIDCNLVRAAELEPSKLDAITKVRVATQNCRSQSSDKPKTIEIEDSARIKVLVSEFDALRSRSKGIWAAKYSCSTDVTFLQDAKVAARVHVFPCNAIERAPVEGKRYFTYKEGLNRLPELVRVLEMQGKEQECK